MNQPVEMFAVMMLFVCSLILGALVIGFVE